MEAGIASYTGISVLNGKQEGFADPSVPSDEHHISGHLEDRAKGVIYWRL